jgi:hypothetical protein
MKSPEERVPGWECILSEHFWFISSNVYTVCVTRAARAGGRRGPWRYWVGYKPSKPYRTLAEAKKAAEEELKL